MGCGIVKSKNDLEHSVAVPDERNRSASQSNLLLRYETLENVYKIKLVPPKSGK